MEGFLEKKGAIRWQKRYFSVDGTTFAYADGPGQAKRSSKSKSLVGATVAVQANGIAFMVQGGEFGPVMWLRACDGNDDQKMSITKKWQISIQKASNREPAPARGAASGGGKGFESLPFEIHAEGPGGWW